MSLQHHSLKNHFVHQLHMAFTSGIDIYNQAVLKRTSPLDNNPKFHIRNNNELIILFQLKGEIEGQIVCSMELNSTKNISSIRSLFTESMNILLGKFLTEIEDETGYMSVISTPELLEDAKKIEQLSSNISKYKLVCSTTYNLHTISHTYPCKIQILANKKVTKEV